MGVFLTILKILGIVLASVLGLIIILLLLVLYAPVRYKLKGAYNGDVDGTVKVRWLFAGIKSTIVKNDEKGMSVLVKLKIFGIPIKKIQVLGGDKDADSGGKDKKARKKEKVKKKKQKKKDKDYGQEITVIDPGTPELDEIIDGGAGEYKPGADGHIFSGSDNSGQDSGSGINALSDGSDSELPVLSEKEQKKAEKKRKKAEKKAASKAKKAAKKAAKEATAADGSESEPDEKKNIADRIDAIYDKTEEILGKVSEKTEMIRTKKNHIIEFFDRPYVQNTIKRGKKVLRRLFKNLLPRKGDVNLLLGLKNPASTGQIVGKVSMFYPYYYRWLHLTPEFHEQKIEADMWCKGRIHLGSFAIPALFLYLSKDFKKTMNLAKKI